MGQLAAALDGDVQQVMLDVQGNQVYGSQAMHQALFRPTATVSGAHPATKGAFVCVFG